MILIIFLHIFLAHPGFDSIVLFVVPHVAPL